MLQTIINLVSGLAGGNIAGSASKQISLGPVWNSLLGLIGGFLGGHTIGSMMNSEGKMDLGSIIGGIVSSGAGGAILTALVGFIKSRMAK